MRASRPALVVSLFAAFAVAAGARAASHLGQSRNIAIVGDGDGDLSASRLLVSYATVADADGLDVSPSLRAVQSRPPIDGLATAEIGDPLEPMSFFATDDARTYVKNMVTGAAQMDGAVVIVAADTGPTAQTREHVLLARQVGVPVVVYLRRLARLSPAERAAVVEQVLRLSPPGRPLEIVDETEPVDESMHALRLWFERETGRPRARDRAFLMPIADASPRGTAPLDGGRLAIGTIETGTVHAGDMLEIVDIPMLVTVDGFERFRKILDTGEAGDNVGLLLRSGAPGDVTLTRGMVIAAPGTIRPHARFRAVIVVTEEGGRHTPFQNGYHPRFALRTADVTGEIELPAGRDAIEPGDHGTITVTLIAPIAMDKGLRFAIREGGHTVGAGVVTEILD